MFDSVLNKALGYMYLKQWGHKTKLVSAVDAIPTRIQTQLGVLQLDIKTTSHFHKAVGHGLRWKQAHHKDLTG